MNFITKEDFKVVSSEASLKAITGASQDNIDNAIAEAQEEVAGYLRPKYDTEKIFAMEGNLRNRQIVMYTADIALYNMTASLPNRMGYETRQERYERAIKWLEGVQAGKIVPDLPILTDEIGNELSQGGVLAYGNGPDRHTW
jgi:phage gp36-like protein